MITYLRVLLLGILSASASANASFKAPLHSPWEREDTECITCLYFRIWADFFAVDHSLLVPTFALFSCWNVYKLLRIWDHNFRTCIQKISHNLGILLLTDITFWLVSFHINSCPQERKKGGKTDSSFTAFVDQIIPHLMHLIICPR